MKKFLVLAWSLALLLAFSACSPGDDGPQEVTVFADASLSEAMTAIAEQYKAEEPEVSILFTFDSSDALTRKIEEGDHCDIFIAAGQAAMDRLGSSQDLIDSDSRLDLLLDSAGGVYPAAMAKGSTLRAAADFFTYLQSGAAMEIFDQAGFVTPEG